jgi:hypothetical protein
VRKTLVAGSPPTTHQIHPNDPARLTVAQVIDLARAGIEQSTLAARQEQESQRAVAEAERKQRRAALRTA